MTLAASVPKHGHLLCVSKQPCHKLHGKPAKFLVPAFCRVVWRLPSGATDGRRNRLICQGARREILLGGLSIPSLSPGPEAKPQEGDCPTCVGGENDTLGTCGSSKGCVSSYDDREERAQQSRGASTSSQGAAPVRSNITSARGLKLLPRPVHPKGPNSSASAISSHDSSGPAPVAIMSPRRPRDPSHTKWHDFDSLGSMHESLELPHPLPEDDEGHKWPKRAIPPLDPNACTLRIFAINDVYMLDHYPHLKACVDAHSNGQNTIVTLAGDFLAPSLLSGLDQGHGAVDVMSAAGVTHVCFGNHECDIPYEDMLSRIDESTFQWVSTNMRDLPMEGRPALPEYDIITVSGPGQERKVALLGLLTDDPGLYRQGSFANATIEPLNESLDRVWGEMEKAGVDAILPMTHQDMSEDVEMAARWGPGGVEWIEGRTSPIPPINMILGGHDHEIMYEDIQGCQIIKAGAEAEYIAVVDLTWPTPIAKAPEVRVSLVDALTFPADQAVRHRVAGHYERIEEVKRSPLVPIPKGVNLSSKHTRFQQTTVGTLLCSAMRDGFVGDGCIFNGGGIRANKDYPDSKFFFLSDLESEMPFNNELVCVNMPGRVVSDIVAFTRAPSKKNPPEEYGGFMQIDDGMRFCDETMRVTHIKNEPLDPDATYSIVVTLIHLQGIDSISPMVEFAKGLPYLPHDGVPCKMVIVNYFSRLMWLMMGSWNDLCIPGGDHISKEAFIEMAKNKFDADFVVDQVFNRCDFDGDGRVSKADMVAAVLFTGFLYDNEHEGCLHREQVHEFAENVLGCTVDEELVDELMLIFDANSHGAIGIDQMRRVTHPLCMV